MPKSRPAADAVIRVRFHRILATFLLIALSVMIVRDIIMRRWGSATPPSSDVTQPSP
jgi:hypothetical protein